MIKNIVTIQLFHLQFFFLEINIQHVDKWTLTIFEIGSRPTFYTIDYCYMNQKWACGCRRVGFFDGQPIYLLTTLFFIVQVIKRKSGTRVIVWEVRLIQIFLSNDFLIWLKSLVVEKEPRYKFFGESIYNCRASNRRLMEDKWRYAIQVDVKIQEIMARGPHVATGEKKKEKRSFTYQQSLTREMKQLALFNAGHWT